MAFQNVSTPRFYINIVEWLASNNAIVLEGQQWRNTVWNTLPVEPQSFLSNYAASGGVTPDFHINGHLNHGTDGKVFLALLGAWINPQSWGMIHDGSDYYNNDMTNIINMPMLGDDFTAFRGFSIGEFPNRGVEDFSIEFKTTEAGHYIGSIVLGTYYDMPNSPDLSLTLTREYGGTKTIETKGGASLSNTMWHKPPMWGDLGAWELHPYDEVPDSKYQALYRGGRRIWDLSFSYIQDSKIFSDLSNINWQEAYTYDYNASGNTLLDDSDSFFSQVIHKTNGGQLPFIFQGDNTNNNPDQFAICKFDMNSFKFSQVANGVYNISLKIREVW